MCSKWKIASMALVLVGGIYNLVSDAVESKNQEERMREIAAEEIRKHEEGS